MRLNTIVALTSLAAIIGCSGDSTGPSSSFENVAGSFAGNTTNISQGVRLNATFSMTMTQSAGSMTGIWGLQGVLDNGLNTVPVAGTGPMTGTVSSGRNPSVTVIVRSTACPNYQGTFSGSYDSTTGRLTISGPIDFFGANSCNVVLSYQATVTLARGL